MLVLAVADYRVEDATDREEIESFLNEPVPGGKRGGGIGRGSEPNNYVLLTAS